MAHHSNCSNRNCQFPSNFRPRPKCWAEKDPQALTPHEVFVCWLEMTFGIEVHSCDEASAKSENHQMVRHYFCTIFSPVIELDKKLPINRSFGINFELVEIASLDKSSTCYLKCHQLLELLLIFSSCYIVCPRHTGLQEVSDSIYTKVLGRQLIVSMFPLNRS